VTYAARPQIAKIPAQHGHDDRDEARLIFSIGVEMVLIAGKEQVDPIARHFGRIGQKFFFIGNVVRGSGKVVYDTPPAGFASWIE
jgi:phosphoribosylaminoimidazole (AIR) synthetase